ncbi:MAG: CADD family putative folate metabolism protein [Candidatus Midichloria sp.]|uniref:PqqC-like protein n=1 Tax=Hyalomma marginatum TaxID=34627 RepID=A0A8S4BVT0_9ACAR|nr:PqqC-like protein [Hyalomma marginatum]CAG7596506.1 PqqC-like protein [Hyalomma marginatum]
MFSVTLVQDLSKYHLLKHPFYQAWNQGALEISTLQRYAKQYFKNVEAFPRYVSRVHSQCAFITDRRVLLENLIDEERGDENHPELWLRFAESLGESREEVSSTCAEGATKNLVEGFLELVKSLYAAGLRALFAYEQQVPAVAESKITGLKKFYGYDNENPGLQFFKVHTKADEWHSAECAALLDKLSEAEQEVAHKAAVKVAELLWEFLDNIYDSKMSGELHGANC